MINAASNSLPFNIEAEQATLGSLIIDPAAIASIHDFLWPEDFYRDSHRCIYEGILNLYRDHMAADYITLCDYLEQQGKLEDIGPDYITSLINNVPTSGNIEHYGRIVEREAILRRLIFAAGEIAAIAQSGDKDAAEQCQQLIFDVTQKRRRGQVQHIKDRIASYMERLDAIHEANQRGVVMGVPTGLTDIDDLTGGLQKSDLVILAARPAIGKTSLAMTTAKNAARQGYHVAIFSLEMSADQLVQRWLADETMIDQSRLRQGAIMSEPDNEWEKIVEATGTLSDLPLWIDDTPRLSCLDLRARAQLIQAQHGLDLIVVDYLQLMKGNGKPENRVQEVSEISRELKAIARELNVPVLALAQLSRAVEGRAVKEPQLSDLRESGAIEQDSDIVAFLHVDEVNEGLKFEHRPYIVTATVAKHRNGPVGQVYLRFIPRLTRFIDGPQRQAGEA
jgi:replicative DNA helicase